MRFLFTLLLAMCCTAATFSQTGYEIKVKMDNFEQKDLYLGYYYGDKQYLRDTAELNQEGFFIFKGEEAYEGGVYLLVLPPDNKFIQILLNKNEQHFTIHADGEKLSQDIKFDNSPDNSLFYDYMAFLSVKRPMADKLNKEIEAAPEGSKEREKAQKKLDELNETVKKHQLFIIENNPNSLTAALIKANLPLDTPEFEGEKADEKRWRWAQKHYFDNINMTDERMLRSPFLFQRIDHYINKMVVQHPDTISLAIDRVLEMVRPAEETFKYYLIHFLNAYAKSKIVGMDAVYVHVVKKYYATGQAPWTEEEQLKKIIDNATTLDPLLVGKIAPDFQASPLKVKETIAVKDVENEHQRFKLGTPFTLHSVKSPYTVLIFWASDCGHCKKSMPKLVEFYENYKTKGVEVFAVCTKTYKDVPACAELLDKHNALNWLNMVDPYYRSKFASTYDVRSTPQIYILDHKKEIISKKIGTEQLPEVMDQIMERDKKKEKG